MLKTQITREELERLGAEIRRHFDLHTVERGLEFQQKGYVYNTEVVPGRAIVSKVQGGQVYDVKLDLDFFGLSECSCPYDGCCEHMAAVFFYAYAVYMRPDAFVKEWKLKQEEPQPAGKASKLHRQTALLASAQPAVSSLKESDPPELWLAHVEREFAAFSERHNQWKYDIEEYYSAAVQTAIRPSTWWLPGTKRLLTAMGLLYALRKLEQDCEAGGQYGANRQLHFKETAEALERRLADTVDEIEAAETARRWPDHLLSLGGFVTRALAAKPAVTYVRWLDMYRLLWTRLLRQEAWVDWETARIDSILADSARLTESEKDDWLKAGAHFDMLAGRDQEAWRKLCMTSSFHPEEGLFYADEFRRTGQWERLWLWLQRLLPQCRKTDRELFRKLCAYAAEAAKPLGREDEWARALVSMLPASYYVYTEFLIRAGRFREWTDYHLAENVPVFELYPSDLRAAESHDPTLVLPLYHQTIERCILQKNRTAYKEAIRLMKKLASLYAQAGQPERYELFLRRLSQHYSRLRAFREELTKGKLLR